ncbi:transglycosylase SLT domain-containing protein [Clostridium autoethanogenum]|uniref:Transglycosylase SLT domain-containing protein n=2 Tax=Clostridium autoethanogenum TaxID=84023 RepID=A0ABM5NZ71_9CLOT|nr:transglycosylase SLT domain-containing protein [Clostridium autoethanogenum]AGY77991.2 transglycosylase SLT domain-containing protein [Clostridium autoethanogenum DSM 10061]
MRIISRVIGTILNLKDMFSPKMKEPVEATKSFSRELKHAQNDVGAFRNKVTSGFSGLKSSIAGFAGGLFAGFNMKSAIAGAQGAQKATQQMASVLKSTGGAAGLSQKQLLDYATAESKLTTFTKGTNIATENMLLTFTNIKGGIMKDALSTVNNMSTALGTDTKASAMQLGKALNDPIKGVTALTKVGVTFTDSQKKTIKSLVSTGQTAKAQQMILSELNREFGGSAKAAGATYEGTLIRIKNTINGLAGSIGSMLVPYMSKFATGLSNATPIISSIIGVVVGTVQPILANIIKDVGKIATNIMPSLGGSTKDVTKTIQKLLNDALYPVKTVFDWLAQHGGAVRLAIVGIGTAFAGWKVATTINTVVKGIKDFKKGLDSLSTVGKGGKLLETIFKLPPQYVIVIAAITAFALIAYEVITHWTQVKTFFSGLWAWIKMKFTNTMEWFSGLPAKWAKYGSDMFTSFKTGAWNIISGIGTWISEKFTNFINFFKNLPTTALQWGKDIVNQLKAGIQAKIDDVVSVAKDLGTKILKGIKNIFGIASPSKEMTKIGNYLIQGLYNGIFKGKDSLKTVISKVFGGAMDFAHGIFTGGDVSGWITTALAITGSPMSWLTKLLDITSRESGDPGKLGTGNPNLVNSVGVNGEYATGLMQMLPSTFREFAISGLGGITNPIANAVAAIRYIKSRYGSPENIATGAGYKGYWTGTTSAREGVADVAENTAELVIGRQRMRMHGGEQVINGQDTKKILSGNNKQDINLNINIDTFIGTEAFADQIGSHIWNSLKTEMQTA